MPSLTASWRAVTVLSVSEEKSLIYMNTAHTKSITNRFKISKCTYNAASSQICFLLQRHSCSSLLSGGNVRRGQPAQFATADHFTNFRVIRNDQKKPNNVSAVVQRAF